MEAITITLVTIIMTIFASSKTIINRFLVIGMCLTTTYYFLNLKFDNTIILWIYDNQWSRDGVNEIFKNGIAFWWVIFMILSFLTFYVLLPIMVGLISNKLIYKYIEKKISKLGSDSEKYKRTVSFLSNKKLTKIINKDALNSLSTTDMNNYLEVINNIVCYLSHFLLCWILLDINNSWQIILTIVLTTFVVIIFAIFTYPLTHIFNFPLKNKQ